MPNWCSTQIKIRCNNKQKLKNLEEIIKEATSYNCMPNCFGTTWLGNLVVNSGIGTVDENMETDLECRGWITFMENRGNKLIIDTETAWAPKLKLFLRLLEKYLPEAELIYLAEEPGCEIHCTNDPSLAGKYYLVASECSEVEEYIDYNEKELIKELKRIIEIESDNLDEVLDSFYKSEYSTDIQINQWEYVPAEEWD